MQGSVGGGQRMAITRRIFVSSPRIEYLDNRQKELKQAIVNEIEALGYEAQMFGSGAESRGLPSKISWSPTNADKVMKRCVGAAILGFPIWQGRATTVDKTVSLVSEYCHYEGAIARTLGLPILPVLDYGVDQRVFFNPYGGNPFFTIPAEADHTWVKENDFQAFLGKWHKQLKERKDIFLGYSSEAEGTAKNIARLLSSYEATVLDWQDFDPGTILEQIDFAAKRCSAGIFLFTNSDKLEGQGDTNVYLHYAKASIVSAALDAAKNLTSDAKKSSRSRGRDRQVVAATAPQSIERSHQHVFIHS